MQKKLFKTLVFLLLTASISAQHIENSPYSKFGLGDIYQNQYVQTVSMGGLSMGYRSANSVNFNNPASYTCYDTLSFVFETGLGFRYNKLITSASEQKTGGANFSHIVVGFPLMKHVGVSIGLVPFSKKQYLNESTQTIDSIGDVIYTNSGEGGLNRLYIGTGIQTTKWLSLGANLSYVFGGLYKNQSLTFPSSSDYYNTQSLENIYASDIMFDFGMQTHFEMKKGRRINFGLDWQPFVNVNAKRSLLARSFTSGVYAGQIYGKDTTIYVADEKGTFSIPDRISFGFVYENPKKFTTGMDVGIQNWSNSKTYGLSDSLQNSLHFAVGAELIPNADVIKGYLKKIHYRAGFRYEQSYVKVNNNQLTEYAVSVGLGLPIRSRAKKYSLLNVGFEYGSRGTVNDNLIQEQFMRATLSFSIYENWFYKRKYD